MDEILSGLRVVEVDSLTKPAWVTHLLGGNAETADPFVQGRFTVQVTESAGLAYVQVVLPGAIELESTEFQRGVTDVYAVIRDQLDRREARHPLRFWNFVPGIHRPAHEGMVHYEVFNAGRFAAFADWYRTPSFGPRMVAASGVGHHSPDFVVQVLAAERPGRGLENPRQRSAYRYSERYGPVPPCFARATVVETPSDDPGRGLMIVSGTASVVGEDSYHHGDLKKQLAETCLNLTSLIEPLHPGNGRPRDPLSCFEELRAYVVDDTSRARLVEMLAASFPNLRHLELMGADLCRTDLLVEVEGVVSLEAASAVAAA